MALPPLEKHFWQPCIDWDNITTKATLTDEIKRSVKKIEKEIFLNSVLDFTVRLRV